MWVASEPCSGSVMPNAKPRRPSARSSTQSAFCFSAVVDHEQQPDVVADDRVFVLKVVVKAESTASKVLANDRHTVNGAVTSTVFSREGVAVEAGRISQRCLVEKVFPLVVWKAAVLPIGTGIFSSMIKEPDVVIRLFQRSDF